MPPIYITEQNTKIRIRNNCIRVERETGQDPEIAAAVLEIAAIEKGLEGKFTLPALRGAEGSAAAAYFSGFRKLFSPEWNFRHRRQHPSTDPVNGMLSYGYTLLSQAASAAVYAGTGKADRFVL